MTEPDIFQEAQDDFERQRLDAMWKKYGGWVIAAALALVLGTAVSTAYRSTQAEKEQRLTVQLLDASKPDGNALKTIDQLQKFADSSAGTNQAAFALLRAGALAAEQNDKVKAAKFYDAAAADQGADPAFRQLGDLLSVQMQMDSGDPAQLSSRLDPLAADHAAWRYSAREAQGYLAIRASQKDASQKERARQIFTTLSQDANTPQSMAARAADIARSLN
jgi:hypothetical protein